MTISTLAELRTAVQNWLIRTDATVTDRQDEFIVLAEAEINRTLRVRQMEATADLTINAQSIALPTGFMAMRRLYINASTKVFVSYLPPEEFYERNAGTDTGLPTAYTYEGDNIVFGPSPDATYTGKSLYWKRQDITSSAHALFTQNPDLYLFGALRMSATFLRGRHLPEFLPVWEAFYSRAVAQIQAADIKDRHSGSVLQARPYPSAP